MNHTTKSIIALVFLLGVIGTLGIIIGQGNGGSLFFSNLGKAVGGDGLTGAVAGEDCQGENCSVSNQSCKGYACSVACYTDKDCDDKTEATDDICRNPGTTYSLCVNRVKK